jgi:ankyrin repeat protein
MIGLLTLPPEILLDLSRHLEYTSDLNALAQSCSALYYILNQGLYRLIHKELLQPPPMCRNTGLHWAAENGKDSSVRRLMKSGISPNTLRDNGRNPIILAAANGHTEVVRILLDYGVNANCWTGFIEEEPRENPLSAAIKGKHPSVVRLLIEYGVELEFDFRTLENMVYLPTMPLSLATMYEQTEIVEILLKHGCDPCLPPDKWESDNSFLIAAWCNEEVFRLFLGIGVKPEFPENGRWQLLNAVINGRIGLANYFFDWGAEFDTLRGRNTGFSGPIPDEVDDLYQQFSDTASMHPEMAALLLKRIDVDEIIERKYLRPMRSLMEGAAAGGYEDLIKRCLEVDWPEKHTTDKDDWLWHLTLCLSKAVNGRYINIVQLMLDHGADPNGAHPTDVDELNEDGVPAILEAIRRDDIEIVKLLIEKGAEPHPSEPPAWPTAFEECTSQLPISDAKFEIIRLLVDKGCLAAPGTHASRSLTSQSVNGGERVFDLIRQYTGKDIAPHCYDDQKALCTAARLGKIGIMKTYFCAGFDFNVVGEGDQCLLLLAAQSDQNPQAIVERTVCFMLSHGADIDLRNSKGMTPLLTLCSLKSPTEQTADAATILLEKGANIFIACNNNEFPLVKAAQQDRPNVVKSFLEYFNKQSTPFEEIKNMIEEAIKSSGNEEIRRILSRFYWPRVYPLSIT